MGSDNELELVIKPISSSPLSYENTELLYADNEIGLLILPFKSGKYGGSKDCFFDPFRFLGPDNVGVNISFDPFPFCIKLCWLI